MDEYSVVIHGQTNNFEYVDIEVIKNGISVYRQSVDVQSSTLPLLQQDPEAIAETYLRVVVLSMFNPSGNKKSIQQVKNDAEKISYLPPEVGEQ